MKYDFAIDMSTDNSLSLILRRIKPNSKVIEFGPAKGYMTAYLKKELNCTVYCVEIDQEAAKIAQEFCDKMIVSDLNKMEWISEIPVGESFDHIIFADVLEHLMQPNKILKAASNYLKEEGTILTSIPNIGHAAVILELMEGKFDYRKLGLLDETHLRFFTRRSIAKMLNECGLFPTEWMSTKVLPNQTELEKDYENIPRSVREYLTSREDSHVYQFITESKKIVNIPHDELKIHTASSSYIHSKFLQVFWSSTGDFNEENSCKIPLKNPGKTQQYSIKLHPVEAGKIRVDFTNFVAVIENVSIRILGKTYANCYTPIKSLNPEEIRLTYGMVLLNKNQLFAINDDPQSLLELSVEELQEYDEFYVEIEFSYNTDLSTVRYLLEQIKEYEQLNMTIKADLKNAVKENQHLRSKLEEKENINDQLKIKYNLLKSNYQTIENKYNESLELTEKQTSKLEQLEFELNELINLKNEIEQSNSWKLTAPLRWLVQNIKNK